MKTMELKIVYSINKSHFAMKHESEEFNQEYIECIAYEDIKKYIIACDMLFRHSVSYNMDNNTGFIYAKDEKVVGDFHIENFAGLSAFQSQKEPGAEV
jgi:hypothetical protein